MHMVRTKSLGVVVCIRRIVLDCKLRKKKRDANVQYSGYWQVAMNSANKKKTAFTIREGNFEFDVMFFGLTNTPATFQ
ncbi:hypothetical protein G9A89_022682 [Geosiphon pyriformis]|nr:hypothetical protein G9A89_022682 [Geosiphon pyriformis]